VKQLGPDSYGTAMLKLQSILSFIEGEGQNIPPAEGSSGGGNNNVAPVKKKTVHSMTLSYLQVP